MIVQLGKASVADAEKFCVENVDSKLGSLTTSGFRRVLTNVDGESLDLLRSLFSSIAVVEAEQQPQSVVLEVSEPPSCVYRGSQRKTCCGSPNMWICKELKTDCVATSADAKALQAMVATDEAKKIAVCEVCNHRVERGQSDRVIAISTETVAVVIPCHNYAEFLGECLQSIADQSFSVQQIIVVDDSSSDDPRSVCERFSNVQYERVEFGDVHRSRQHGLQFVQSNYVAFIDADDKIPKGYFEEAVSIFRADRRVAITFPRLEYFGDATGSAHGTDRSLPELRGDDLEQRNWISAGSVLRTELIHQSLGFNRSIDPNKNWTQDWHIARSILRSGNWIARKMQTPLLYRKHGTNMSDRPNESYWNDADFGNEKVTIVIAFSGRWDCWPRLLAWLQSQSWPVQQVNLLIMNSTHAPLTASMLGLQDWEGGIVIDRLDVGYPRLADKERRKMPKVGKAVEAAVAGLYNRATTILGTEYVVFVEDDVIPHDRNLIEKMFRRMGAWVAGVTGVYRQRYQADKCCVFDVPYEGDKSFRSLHGTGVEQVGGSGFGCLMTRRSVLRRFPLAGDGPGRFFDTAFALEVSRADGGNWRWLLDRDIQADHLLSGDLEFPQQYIQLTVEESVAHMPEPVAFDFGGTLRVQDGIPGLRDHVGRLNRAGVPCVIISAIEDRAPTSYAENEIAGWTDSRGTPLKFSHVRFVRYSLPATAEEMYKIGLKKADVMKELNAKVLFDDLELVCKAVNDSGLLAVPVGKSAVQAELHVEPLAFDYGGTLRVSDGVQALRDAVAVNNKAGIPCVIISAISEGYPTEGIEQEIRDLTDRNGTPLRFSEVRFVYYPYPFTEKDIYEAGLKKAAVMKELGASVIYDDSEHVCRAVLDAGLQSVRVARPKQSSV